MTWNRIPIYISFILITVLSSCRYRGDNAAVGGGEETDTLGIMDLTDECMSKAEMQVAQMDTLELAAQVMLPAVYASTDRWTMNLIREYADRHIGGVIFLKGDSESACELADSMQRWSKVPALIAIDAEWGLNMRLSDAPKFPANGNISDNTDEQLMYDYGYEVAEECRQLGINMLLGPVMDVSGSGGLMKLRSFGSDPERVARLGIAYARGLEDGGVISVAKHFPGQGSVSRDTHRRKGVINRSLQSMDSIDLKPFKEWAKYGLTGVMVGHLAVPSIDGDMLPAAVSPTVITDLLKTDIGFRGLVLTDAMNMGGAEGYGADRALIAGAHLIVAPMHTLEEMERIRRAVRDSLLPFNTLRDRVREILFYKNLYSLRSSESRGRIEYNRGYADSIARSLEYR